MADAEVPQVPAVVEELAVPPSEPAPAAVGHQAALLEEQNEKEAENQEEANGKEEKHEEEKQAGEEHEGKEIAAPESVPAPEPEAPADANQLMKDIFGSDDEDEEGVPAAAGGNDDADEQRAKAQDRLAGAKKAKRHREDKPKKSKKDKDKEKESKKKKSKSTDDAPAAAGGAASDEEKFSGKVKQQREKSDFDRVIDSLKRTGNRRKKDDAAADEAARAFVKELLTKMMNAAQQDEEAVKAGHPATFKLKLLSEATAAVNKAHIQPFFVPDILPVVALWLSPSADGTLPNLSVREGMLNILKQLQNVDTESLKQSRVGHAVMGLYKHPQEHPKNKKVAQELIERWSRPLFQLTDSYRDLRDANEDGEMGAPRKRLLTTSIQRDSALDKYVQAKKEVKPRVRAQIPNRDPLDFTKQPKSFRDSQGDEPLPSMPPSMQFKVSKTKFAEKLNAKGANRSPHFVKMSVEGRGFGQ